MCRLIAVALFSMVVAGSEPLFAKDYVLKLELKIDNETKVGNQVTKRTSDLQTIEVLVAPERRFQAKTTRDNGSLSMKGKLTETEEGKFAVEIDCRHSSAEHNRTRCKTFVGLTPGEPILLGGMATNGTTETLNEILAIKQKSEFRLTLIENDSEVE